MGTNFNLIVNHNIIQLKSGLGNLTTTTEWSTHWAALFKSNEVMLTWTPSKSVDPFTHICPRFLS